MRTDVIAVSGGAGRIREALEQVDKVVAYKELSGKSALHLRLLTEEMMGLMRSITGETEGKFWIEESDNVYQLHLQVDTLVDSEKRKQLLATSSSGKNEASKGLMGKLREFFFRAADEDIASFNNPLINEGMSTEGNMPVTDWQWSLLRYVENYNTNPNPTEVEKEAWDELEKSVVSHVADDIKVSIAGMQTEMILVKKIN